MERVIYKSSVRELVEFILRSGDIDNRIVGRDQLKAMQEGSRIHRKIQNSMGPSYLPEVPLYHLIELEKYDIRLEGRADGIITEKNGVTIDEIKTSARNPKKLEEAEELHLAQAKCYAYIYSLEKELEEIGVQITCVHVNPAEEKKEIRKSDIRRFHYQYHFSELSAWFADLIAQYKKWTDYLYDWKEFRTASIKKLTFPYEYRKGQKKLVEDVYRTIIRKKMLFLQAPTGVGKTLATLFPSIKAVGEGKADRIFYLTGKTVTGQVAKDSFSLLYQQGLRMKYVLLTAKEKICPCEEMQCDPLYCPRAKGHFDRINQAVYESLQEETYFDRQKIEEAAEKYQVCPFELGLDLTDWTDVIIGDYNYAFDPQAKLKRYFADGAGGDYIFLVDEAHNLLDRAREMYSATLYKEEFLSARKILKPLSKKADKILGSCNRYLLEKKRECEDYAILEDIGSFGFHLMRLSGFLDEFMREHPSFEGREELLDFYFKLKHFLLINDLVDESYVIYSRHMSDGRFALKLFCVNPAKNLQACFDSGISAVLFSATFLPVDYYKKLLSYEADPYAVYAESSFSEEQRLLLIADDVSTKYTRRGPEEYARAAAHIRQMVKGRKGNYIAFFPSYKLMQEVYEAFQIQEEKGLMPEEKFQIREGEIQIEEGKEKEKKDIRLILQKSNMSPEEREAFLAEFSAEGREESLLAFCVMGGIFSEGIDLKEDALIGAAIYGTGIPQVDIERKILQDYYDREDRKGFAYAYQYPGMNKVLQAAGRVIRTLHDKGVILLMDDRFLRYDYRLLFPREWASFKKVNLKNAGKEIALFWKNKESEESGK